MPRTTSLLRHPTSFFLQSQEINSKRSYFFPKIVFKGLTLNYCLFYALDDIWLLMCFKKSRLFFFFMIIVLGHYRRSKYSYQKMFVYNWHKYFNKNWLLIVPYDIYGIALKCWTVPYLQNILIIWTKSMLNWFCVQSKRSIYLSILFCFQSVYIFYLYVLIISFVLSSPFNICIFSISFLIVINK